MFIDQLVYNQMIAENAILKRRGGFLGGKGKTVVEHCPDKELSYYSNHDNYSFDIRKLKSVIERWQKRNISFVGVYNNVPLFGDSFLSDDDITAIEQLLLNYPIDEFYYCLIGLFESHITEIICYVVRKKTDDRISIERDELVVVKNEM